MPPCSAHRLWRLARCRRCSWTWLYSAGTAFGEAPLFDGSYSMVFEMWDAAGNCAYSDAVTFDCANGEISTTVYED